jgi:hypothetical protein
MRKQFNEQIRKYKRSLSNPLLNNPIAYRNALFVVLNFFLGRTVEEINVVSQRGKFLLPGHDHTDTIKKGIQRFSKSIGLKCPKELQRMMRGPLTPDR